ncbi:MAG: DUF882 domain-containing protein [Hyphomicrobiales bacterium]|nr:DUF882 domain-containing protein [Hyphomicrobiales bacterium]
MADRPLRIPGLALALSVVLAFVPISLEGAGANGDTRTLSIFNVHTNESGTVTFKRNGVYDAEGLKQLSWLLRDWRRDEPTAMSPRLFDILWEVHQETGSQEPFHAVSGYRSPETNAMLRRNSHLVAEHSQHMLGKAMDSFLPDVPIERMREIAMHLQRGGVGYYPTSGSPFVHIDAGSVRAWPRMTREQLARLFPDGKTVHIPADGHPLPGYEEAKAEILAAGGTVAGYTAVAEADAVSTGHHKSLWAALFGGGEDEDEDEAMAASGRTLSRAAAARQSTQIASLSSSAAVPSSGNDAGVHAFIMSQAATTATVQPPSPATTARSRNLQAGRTTDAATPTQVASAGAPSSGTPSFLSALRGDATASDAGTTIAVRSPPDAQTGTTIALRSEPTDEQQGDATAGSVIAAFAPLPPPRPKSLLEIASLAEIPLPPTRPNDIDPVALRSSASAAAANADEPNTGELVTLDHPLPPTRPQGFGLAASMAVASNDALTIPVPVMAAGFAAAQRPNSPLPASTAASVAAVPAEPKPQVVGLDHPMPPARQVAMLLPATNASGAGDASAASATPAGPSHQSPTPDDVTALFEASALVPTHRLPVAQVKVANAVVRAALPKVAQDVIARPSSTAGHFMTSATPPIANHFSGKAVQPLNALGFATTE